MKKLVLLLALLLGAIGAYAANMVHIHTKSGEVVSFKYADKPEIRFVGGTMTITTAAGDDPVTLELGDIEALKPEKTASSVDDLTNPSNLTFYTDREGVHFCGVEDGAQAIVATLDGRVVVSTTVNGGEFHFLTADYAKGVYIIKINQFTTKVIL